MKKKICFTFILLFSFSPIILAQQVQVLSESTGSVGPAPSPSPSKSASGGDPNFFQGKTKIGNIFALRDPFKSSAVTKKAEKNIRGGDVGFIRNGVFTNRPSIEGLPLEKIKIVGVLIGKDRRALAKVLSGKDDKDAAVVTLREGMKIGQNNAELKAILPGGVVLVEKIQNVYGQDEYLETVIPISQN